MDSLDSGRADTDGDGKPNLSNIVVTYNHLLGDVSPVLPSYVDCQLLAPFVCQGDDATTGQYLLPKYRPLPQPGTVVRAGTPLGLTGADTNFDHLHLSVFFARGFNRANNAEKAFAINPLLMYPSAIAGSHRFQSYFPYSPVGSKIPLTGAQALGIGGTCSSGQNPTYPYLNCELNRWSGGGFNFGNTDGINRYNEYFNNSFWRVQTSSPPPPNHVEWSTDYYPLRPANDPAHITDLLEYLTARFTTVYQGPACVLASDTSRTPYREIATCDLSDQDDDSLWTVTAHP